MNKRKRVADHKHRVVRSKMKERAKAASVAAAQAAPPAPAAPRRRAAQPHATAR